MSEQLPTEWVTYERTGQLDMRPWTPDFDMTMVSVSQADRADGHPRIGGMIARRNGVTDDMWYVNPSFFRENYRASSSAGAGTNQPPHDGLGFVLNEVADMATNGIQWLKNIKAGVSTADEGLAEMNSNWERITALWKAAKASSTPEPSAGAEVKQWRCFHCGEVFTDTDAATEHFGPNQGSIPGCKIDLAEYRRMEELHARNLAEDTDKDRAYYRLQSEMQIAVRRAEEAGYAKGLKDAGFSGEPSENWQHIAGARQLEIDRLKDQISEYRDALSRAHGAAGLSGEPSGWQPIETAPKDGSHILVANLHDKTGFGRTPAGIQQPWSTVAHYWAACFNPDEAGFYPSVECGDRQFPLEKGAGITHWKPLDGFPSTKTGVE